MISDYHGLFMKRLTSFVMAFSVLGAEPPPSSLKAVLDGQKAAVPGFDPQRAEKDFEALWVEATKQSPIPADPEQALDRIHRFLFKEKGWTALPAGPSLPADLLFVPGVLREGRGSQPALAVTAFLIAERAGVPARLAAIPDRLLVGIPSPKGPVWIDPVKGPPFRGREAIAREAGMLDGMRETDLLFPVEKEKIPAYLRSRLGARLLAVGEASAARDHFETALAELPMPEILYGYGSALLAMNDSRAVDILGGLAQNPSFYRAKAHVQVSRLKLAAGDLPGARAAAAEAAKLSVSDPLIPYVRGLIAAFEGRHAEARAEFEAALAIAPDQKEARAALVEVLRHPEPADAGKETGDAARALELLRGTLSRDEKVSRYVTGQLLHMGTRAAPALFAALAGGDDALRLQAVRMAPSVLPGFPSHAVLRAGLRDPSLPVRAESLRLIVKHQARSAADPLHHLLAQAAGTESDRDQGEETFLREAAYALLAFGTDAVGQKLALPRTAPDLESADAATRLAAAQALSKTTGHETARLALIPLADTDPAVRTAAAEAMGRSGEIMAVTHLIPALEDPEATVRAAALAALERLTRQRFGDDAGRWRAWWTEKKGK